MAVDHSFSFYHLFVRLEVPSPAQAPVSQPTVAPRIPIRFSPNKPTVSRGIASFPYSSTRIYLNMDLPAQRTLSPNSEDEDPAHENMPTAVTTHGAEDDHTQNDTTHDDTTPEINIPINTVKIGSVKIKVHNFWVTVIDGKAEGRSTAAALQPATVQPDTDLPDPSPTTETKAAQEGAAQADTVLAGTANLKRKRETSPTRPAGVEIIYVS